MESAGVHVGNLTEEAPGFRGALERMTSEYSAGRARRIAENRQRLGVGAVPPGERHG